MAIPNANLAKVAFSTAFRYEQVRLRGNASYTMGTNAFYNSTTVNIAHGLGYKPFFRIYIQFPGSTRFYQMETGPVTFGLVGSYQIANISSDNTNIVVQMESYNAAGGSGLIYYRIYEEQQ